MHWIKIIFCLVIGAFSFYYGLKLLKIVFKVKKWDKVQATVISKAVVPKKLTSGSRATKTVSIEYSYTYKGTPYKNNKVFLVELLNGEKDFTQQTGEKFLSGIGSEAEVFVDPQTPAQSVMYCDGFALYLFAFIAGSILLLVGIVYLVRSF